jgi:hypothetical protein
MEKGEIIRRLDQIMTNNIDKKAADWTAAFKKAFIWFRKKGERDERRVIF